jgi:hypothetical protein
LKPAYPGFFSKEFSLFCFLIKVHLSIRVNGDSVPCSDHFMPAIVFVLYD